MKKILSGTVSALMIATSIPTVSFAADQQTRGNIGGYDYEMWNKNGQGQVSMNPGAGSFTCSWSNIENFLARMGKNFDSQKKKYKQIGEIVLTYDVEYTPRGNSYMCVYGWTRNPLMEYYIVEGWGDWRPPGNDGERKGTVTLNGNTYDIAKTMRYNQPSLDGTATFPQYWSIRQTSGSANNQTNYMKGTIDVSKHFDAWSKAGLDMSGTLYEVSLNIEGYRSNGSANVKSVTVSTDGSGAGAVQQGGGQQQGGFDMGGGQQQGGFDMGNFDWSQFGGQQGGQQAGGQQAGGQQTGGNTGNSTSDINSKVTKWGDANGDGSVDMGEQMQELLNNNRSRNNMTVAPGTSFEEMLALKREAVNTVKFSKHASERLFDRDIDLSEEQMKRLNDGVKQAGQKGCVGFQVGGSECRCRQIKEKTESFLNVFCDFIVKTTFIVCFGGL